MNAVSPALAAAVRAAPWDGSVVCTHPDAAILGLRDDFRAAVAEVTRIEFTSGISDEVMDKAIFALADACQAIVDSPPAQTAVGRALKAAAAMHKLIAAFNENLDDDWGGMGEELAWHVLSEIAGDEYVPTFMGRGQPPRRVLTLAGARP